MSIHGTFNMYRQDMIVAIKKLKKYTSHTPSTPNSLIMSIYNEVSKRGFQKSSFFTNIWYCFLFEYYI